MHGETGLLVPAGELTSFADAMEMLIRNRSERARLGNCARARALAYTWDDAADATEDHFRSLIG